MPELYIITGANGAGKSSIGATYLPVHIRNNYSVFDGDKLYMQKQRALWESGIKAIKEAKKIALAFVVETFEKLVEEALRINDNFVYEGHFTNDATWEIPIKFKENKYIIYLIFLGLDDPDLSESRVTERVKTGGHYVPRLIIEDNFYGNLEKLNKYHSLINGLTIIDTSQAKHVALAKFIDGQVAYCVSYNELPGWFIKYLPELSGKIKSVME
jgi:predicted ABC-type ATPase